MDQKALKQHQYHFDPDMPPGPDAHCHSNKFWQHVSLAAVESFILMSDLYRVFSAGMHDV